MSAPSAEVAEPAGEGLSRQEKVFTMVGALLGLLLAALDQTIVSTAGPTIQRELGIAPSLYTWITTAYLVASTVCVPVYGKLSDLYGRKAILLSGIAIFLAGSAVCGVAQSVLQLILFRAVQGVGAASLFTSAFAVVADLFPPQERGKWQGLFGACFGLSSVIGPLAGGFLTDNFGWHWVFFVNLPIGLAAMAFIVAKMPALRRDHGPVRIDVLGTAALVVAVVPLLVALSLGRATLTPGETGFLWGSWPILTMLATSLVGAVAFVAAERRAADPIVDLTMFGDRPFAMGVLTTFVAGATFLGGIVFLPLFMVNVVGLSATSSGLTTLPLTFGIVGGNILTGQLVARLGRYKVLIVSSLALLVLAFGVLAFTLSPSSTQGEVTLMMVLLGLGLGPSIPLFTLHLQNAVEPRKVGVATSTSTFARQMGSTVGLALLGTVFGTTLTDGMATRMATAAASQQDGPMPAEMVARFRGEGDSSGAFEEGAPRGTFDRAAVEARVHAAFSAQRTLVKRALQEDDPAAMATLAADPRLPEPMKAALSGGGPKATVGAGFEAQRAAVAAAFAAPDVPAALADLERAPGTSPVLAARLSQLYPELLASPAAREAVKENILQRLDVARTEAQAKAVEGAVNGALSGLDAAEAQAIETVGRVELALKEAFTEAISRVYLVGIGLALLALSLGIALPEVALRKAGGPPAPPAE